jgi:hypothetical protein
MTLELISINQIALAIPESMSDLAWQQARAYRSLDARWNFYLNQIASQLLAEYIREDFPQLRTSPQTDIWPLVNGSLLELNHKRIILLPSKVMDRSELVIPQEWIDIPAWAGDYFLAVSIDPDEQTLHCWGYTTHQRVKAKADYDARERTYSLGSNHLISDVSGLWVIQQLNPTEVTQTEIAPLASVAPTQAENLLQRLAPVSHPRLEIPFGLWGALISDRAWRRRLVELRQGETSLPTELTTAVTRLGGWAQNLFTAGWQAVEDFFAEDGELAFALRQTSTPTSIVRRAKALALGDRVLLLVIGVEVEAEERLGIQIQLRSGDRSPTLPTDLTLELRSSDDEVQRSITTRDRDNAIQLPRFRSASGTEFKLQLRSGEATLTESFLV